MRKGPWPLALAVACGVLGAAAPDALGRERAPAKASAAGARQAAQLLTRGTQALESGDAAAAEQALSDSYRAVPSTEALYLLGKAAWAQGRKTAGRDFLRRFLADPSSEPESPQAREAQRLLTEPAEPSGEVRVIGESNAKVLVNDHIVGTLPLTLPLLLPVGSQKLTVEAGSRRMEEQVKIVAGHSAELRFRTETGVILVTVPRAVALLTYLPGATDADLAALTTAAQQVVRRAKLEAFRFELAPASMPDLAACVDALPCQRQLAARQTLDYVLSVRWQQATPSGEKRVAVTLLDPTVEDVAGQTDRACAGAGGALVESVEAALDTVLKDGLDRPAGTLVVKSTPPGAEVWQGERKLGVTPLSRPSWAGRYEVSLRHPGYVEQQAQTVVESGKEGSVEVTLDINEPAPKPLVQPTYIERTIVKRKPRPRWRFIVGGVAMGAGLLGLGFGGSALAYDNTCAPTGVYMTYCGANEIRYSTVVPGSILIGLGAAVLVGGAVMMAVPGPTYKETVRTLVAPPAAASSQDGQGPL